MSVKTGVAFTVVELHWAFAYFGNAGTGNAGLIPYRSLIWGTSGISMMWRINERYPFDAGESLH